MTDLILKGRTRILRPSEVRAIVNAIPKNEYKDKFEALLYSGARYSEMKYLFNHPRCLLTNTIKMPSFKKRARFQERYIKLNSPGIRAVSYFLRSKKNLPSYVTWKENLERWAKLANVDPKGIGPKTTRKTWESWLVTQFSNQLEHIFLSQGHTQMVALKYYLMIPFTEEDKEDMKFYTDGWI